MAIVRGTVEVLLVEAKDIKEENKLWCMLKSLIPERKAKKPYVLLKYENQERISGVAQRKGKKQVWNNQKLKFNVEYPVGEDHKHKLTLRIGDKHNLLPNQFLGETTIYLKEVVLEGMEKGKAELESRKYRVVRPDNTYSGEISVAITFTKGKDGVEEEEFGWKESTFVN